MQHFNVTLHLRHWGDSDDLVIKELYSKFMHSTFKSRYWKTVSPPNRWEINLGHYTEDGSKKVVELINGVMQLSERKDFRIAVAEVE